MSVSIVDVMGDALEPTESDAVLLDGINFTKPSKEFIFY